jgi:hypothetical protein
MIPDSERELRPPIDHSIGNQHDHPGQTGPRQVGGEGAEGEHTGKNEKTAEHARHLAACPGLKVDRRTREGPRGGVSAEHAGGDVRHPLPDQLLVDVEVLAALSGDLARNRDRLNQAESGNRKCPHEQGSKDVALEHPPDREFRDVRNRARYFANNRNTQPVDAQRGDRGARADEGQECTRQAPRESIDHEDQQHRDGAEDEARDVDLVEIRDQILQGFQEVRAAGNIDVQEIPQLAGGDEDTGAGGETEQHGSRGKVDEHAQPGKSENDAQSTHHHGHHAGRNHVLGSADRGEWRQDGEHENRDRIGRSGGKVSGRPPEGPDDGRHDRRVESVGRRQASDRRIGDALRDSEHGDRRAGHQIGTDMAPAISAHDIQRPYERPCIPAQRFCWTHSLLSGPKHS